jgi:exopolysaccharide biosynthesis polyprenyl glycosylphosphotransferase
MEGLYNHPVHTANWQNTLSRKMAISDTVLVALTVLITQGLWLGWNSGSMSLQPWRQTMFGVPYYLVTLIIVAVWLAALSISNSRDVKILGWDSREYSRVASASLHVFGLVAIVAYFGKLDLARGFIAFAFPIGTLVLLISRWLWRKWLNFQWGHNKMKTRVLVMGTEESAAMVADRLIIAKPNPYEVAAVTSIRADLRFKRQNLKVRHQSIPVFPYCDNVSALMKKLGIDTLILAGGHALSTRRVREIGWSLESESQRLVVSSGIMGVSSPRLAVKPVAGLPLVQVEPPAFTKPALFAKRVFDIVSSLLGIIVLSPLLLGIAIAVKLGDGGPVIFKQERVGLHGKTFNMLKFRSMRVDAEQVLAELKAQQSTDAGNSTLFKMKDDPRVTKVGKVLRRYSLDEFPQLFNVLKGDMSLVGPRPPLMREVKTYERHVYRKFMVKPGITGLWQVNGRSNLSWEDSVRLDLYYVENWSMMGDLQILFRTFKAVVGRDGAY